MMVIDIVPWRLVCGYGLLILPLAICLWLGLSFTRRISLAALRMTVQLTFVGFYLHVIYDLNNPWLNTAWLMVMVGVADVSVIRHCGFQLRRFAGPLGIGLVVGLVVPVFTFLVVILDLQNPFETRYMVPIAGMIIGNCLRANIVGIGRFYHDVRLGQRAYELRLVQGATQSEALRPYQREAFQAALGPTLAMMATIGLVSIPGMMTGAMIGGVEPAVAVKYQIAIMLCIFSSTAVTIWLTLWLTTRASFDAYGRLDLTIFVDA